MIIRTLLLALLLLAPSLASATAPGNNPINGIDPRNYGAYCDGTVFSAVTGRPVQQGSHDDTAAFQTAAAVAQAIGAPLLVPDGCWIQNFQPVSGLHMQGASMGPNYGFDRGLNGQPYARPILYVIGNPSFGINLNGAETVSFVGFEVNANSVPGAFGTTSCIGSTVGSTGFGGKVWLLNMSVKGCNYGYRPTGGLVYTVSETSDYGGNNNGIGGTFSDFYSLGDTFVSGTTGIDMTQGNGGFGRISGARFEFLTTGISIGGNSGVETDIIGSQFDHFNRCAINLTGLWDDVTISGGGIKAGGLDGSLTVTGAADNGSGLVRLTVNSARPSVSGGQPTGGLSTGDIGTFGSIGGVPGANGTFTITVVDGTHIDLQSSTFSGSYTSGGYGGINNKDADICLGGSSGSKGLHLNNVGFYSSSALGQPPAPAYVLDASTAGANNDYVDIMGGTLNQIGTVVINYNSYTLDVAKWQNGVPPHYRLWANGVNPVITDNTTFSINPNPAICSSSSATGSHLDMSACTDSMLLPGGTTANRPTGISGMIRYNSDNTDIEAYYAGKWNPFNASPVIPFYIGGLTLSNDIGTPNTTVDISNGGAADDANTTVMVLSSPVSKTTGAWAVGSGNGCLDTGSVANSTWYHIFLIFRSDTGVTDILCSTSATSPTMPANYTSKRRIGSIKTNGSAQILPFTQIGSVFWWGTATLDVNTSTLGTSASLQTLNVPTGVKVSPICRYSMSNNGQSVILTSADETDVAPANAYPIAAAPGADLVDLTIAAGTMNTACPLLTTNTSAQVRARASAASTTLSIVTRGWVD